MLWDRDQGVFLTSIRITTGPAREVPLISFISMLLNITLLWGHPAPKVLHAIKLLEVEAGGRVDYHFHTPALILCCSREGCWESLDCKEIQPVHPKGDKSWMFIGRTDAEAETPILWPPNWKNWLTGIDPDAGKDWRWDKGKTKNEMVGWRHWLNGHKLG